MRSLVALLIFLFLPLQSFALSLSGGGGGNSLQGVPCPDVGGAHINTNAQGVPFCGASSSGGAPGNAAADGITKGILALNSSRFTCVSGICDLGTTLAGCTLTTPTIT